jgi:Rrf2 family protein
MRLTSRTDYALRAVMELAIAGEEPLTTIALGKSQGIPSSYLGAVLAQLRRAGIVTARRGAEGGWALAKSPKLITLADVIRAVDGTLTNVAGTRPEQLNYKGAAKGLREVLVAIRAAEREILEGVSLADAVAQRFPSRIKRLLDNPSAWR